MCGEWFQADNAEVGCCGDIRRIQVKEGFRVVSSKFNVKQTFIHCSDADKLRLSLSKQMNSYIQMAVQHPLDKNVIVVSLRQNKYTFIEKDFFYGTNDLSGKQNVLLQSIGIAGVDFIVVQNG